MNCPECKTAIDPKLKACGSLADYTCQRCGFFMRENTGFMNFGDLHDWALKEAQFRRIVRKAMIAEGMTDLDQQTDFMIWLIGPDFGTIPYMIQNRAEVMRDTKKEPEDWMQRIKDKSRLLNINGNTPVYAAIRAAAEQYKSSRILLGFN